MTEQPWMAMSGMGDTLMVAMSLAMTVRKVLRSVEMRLWRMETSCEVLRLVREAIERLMKSGGIPMVDGDDEAAG